MQGNLGSVISVGDQQSCQQPGSCTKGVMVSRLRSQATGDSTSKPALTSKRPVNFPCRIFSLSSFFFSPTYFRETSASRRLHSLITKHGTPKAKGAYPRLYAKQRPGPPGAARGTPFPSRLLSSSSQLPLLLRTASCVGPQFRLLVPQRPTRFANSRMPPTDSHITPTVCYLSTNVAHAYARGTFFGTADDQTLGTPLKSLLAFAGNTSDHTLAIFGLQNLCRPPSPSTVLTGIEANLHAYPLTRFVGP